MVTNNRTYTISLKHTGVKKNKKKKIINTQIMCDSASQKVCTT